MVNLNNFKEAVRTLFDEALLGMPEGQDYAWIVEHDSGGFLDSIGALTAAEASYRPTTETNSVAAHTNHVRYALAASNAEFDGSEVQGGWEDTWALQSVDEQQWKELVESLRSEFVKLRKHLFEIESLPPEDGVIGLMAAPAHIFYHLGAVRQLMRIATASSAIAR